jgi:hypothetical protein
MEVIPRTIFREAVSAGERRVRHLLAGLEREGRVVHSLNLPRHEYKRWGEADFVVVTREALLVLEVKGGIVERRNGVWFFTNGRGEAREAHEPPHVQAGSAMHAVLNVIRREGREAPAVAGYAIVFPFTHWTDVSLPDLPRDLVLDAQDCISAESFAKAFDRVTEWWSDRTRASGRTRSPVDYMALTDCLLPDFLAVESLPASADAVRDETVHLTKRQAATLETLAENDRVLIRGPAGTGKTLLAAAHSRSEIQRGLRPVILVPRPHLKRLFERATPGARVALPQELDPIEAEGAIRSLIVDEGQLLLDRSLYERLDRAVAGGMSGGRWRWLMDDTNQALTAIDEETLARLRAASVAWRLDENVRSARSIVQQTRLVLGTDVGVATAISHGLTPHLEDIADEALVAAVVAHRIAWLERGALAGQIAVLSSPSVLDHLRTAIPDAIVADGSTDIAGIADRTVLASPEQFLGMERDWVIVAVADAQPGEVTLAKWLYLAMTRATTGLAVFISESAGNAVRQLEISHSPRVIAHELSRAENEGADHDR